MQMTNAIWFFYKPCCILRYVITNFREGNGNPLQYSCLENPMDIQSLGSLRVWYDWDTSLSCIGEGNGNPVQYSCLENPRDRGACWAAVYGVPQSRTRQTQLSSSSSSSSSITNLWFICRHNGKPLQYSCLENSMDRGTWKATYSLRGCKESDTTDWLSLTHK